MTVRPGATFHGCDAGHGDGVVQSAQAHLVGMQPLLQEAVHPEPLQAPHHLPQGEALQVLLATSSFSKLLKCFLSASSFGQLEILVKKKCRFFELFIRGHISA